MQFLLSYFPSAFASLVLIGYGRNIVACQSQWSEMATECHRSPFGKNQIPLFENETKTVTIFFLYTEQFTHLRQIKISSFFFLLCT